MINEADMLNTMAHNINLEAIRRWKEAIILWCGAILASLFGLGLAVLSYHITDSKLFIFLGCIQGLIILCAIYNIGKCLYWFRKTKENV